MKTLIDTAKQLRKLHVAFKKSSTARYIIIKHLKIKDKEPLKQQEGSSSAYPRDSQLINTGFSSICRILSAVK